MGDEGSGFRIGMDALQAIMRAFDHRDEPTIMASIVLERYQLARPVDLVAWLYQSDRPRNAEVAQLVPIVLEAADEGDSAAERIIERAAQELVLMANAVMVQSAMTSPKIAFAGGLLSVSNRLSRRVCELLNLSSMPQSKYSPVVGAALLAQIQLKEHSC